MSEPRTPVDVDPLTSLGDLVERYHHHHGVVVDSRHGIGEPLPAPVVAFHALRALVYQHALVERAMQGRWLDMVAALSHGATVGEVAGAAGTVDAAIRVGLCGWADSQRHFGLITDAQRDEVYDLVGGAR